MKASDKLIDRAKGVMQTHHHELLQLVQGVEVPSSLQQLAGGHEVASARLLARVQPLQQALQRPQLAALQTGLQDPLQEHLLRTLLLTHTHTHTHAGLFTIFLFFLSIILFLLFFTITFIY